MPGIHERSSGCPVVIPVVLGSVPVKVVDRALFSHHQLPNKHTSRKSGVSRITREGDYGMRGRPFVDIDATDYDRSDDAGEDRLAPLETSGLVSVRSRPSRRAARRRSRRRLSASSCQRALCGAARRLSTQRRLPRAIHLRDSVEAVRHERRAVLVGPSIGRGPDRHARRFRGPLPGCGWRRGRRRPRRMGNPHPGMMGRHSVAATPRVGARRRPPTRPSPRRAC